MGALLGIDVGTTNWKAATFTHLGKLIAIAKTPTVTRQYDVGQDFYDPAQLWHDVAWVVRQVVEQCDGQTIDAVAVTSMAESIVPIDKHGEPCFPIIPWFDTRARAEADSIVQRLGKQRLFELTGLDPNPIFSLPKILWIRAHYPQVYEQAVTWLQMADYITLKLCGAQVTDYTLACRTLAMDMHTNTWSDEILDVAGIPQTTLPAIRASGTHVGRVSVDAATATGLLPGTPVAIGGNDHPCATIPAGVLLGNKILDSSGTAESFLYVAPRQRRLFELALGQRVGSYLEPVRHVIWGGIIASGASVDWAIEKLVWAADWNNSGARTGYDDIMAQTASVAPGARGIMYLPHLRGSGAPYWNPRDAGAFLGLRAHHTGQELLRAVFEGLSMQARMVVEMEERVAGTEAESLCAVGGGTRLSLWQQIKADVIGKTVEVPEVSDASVLGAALLAGVGAGVYADIDEAAHRVDRGQVRYYEPDHASYASYDGLYRIFEQTNAALTSINTQLDSLFH